MDFKNCQHISNVRLHKFPWNNRRLNFDAWSGSGQQCTDNRSSRTTDIVIIIWYCSHYTTLAVIKTGTWTRLSERDDSSINNIVANIYWDEFMCNDTINCWQKFKDLILNLEDEYIPMKKIRPNKWKKPVWISYKALKCARKKKYLRNTRTRITQQ